MSHQPFAALDFGLRVRIELQPTQRPLFSASEGAPAQALTAELAELVSRLRVHSFALRASVEEATTALQLNVQAASWIYARRAALDLAGQLSLARRSRLAPPERTLPAERTAFRVAELCQEEVL
jgi:hypothetical protein